MLSKHLTRRDLNRPLWSGQHWWLYLFCFQIAMATFFATKNIFMLVIDIESTAYYNDEITLDCHTRYISCTQLAKMYPSRIQDCLRNSSLPICSIKCYDTPPATLPSLNDWSAHKNNNSITTSSSSSLPTIWPPIGVGRWIYDPEYCRSPTNPLYPCLMNKYRWDLGPSSHFEPLIDPCALLHQYNISDIHAIGDSLIRHLTQGLVILLNGDYNYRFHNRTCVGDNAFSIYECRREIYKEYQVCHSGQKYITIRAIPFSYHHQHLLDILYPGEGPGNTLYLYGVGLHASDPKKPGAKSYTPAERQTILNSSAYIRDKWKGKLYSAVGMIACIVCD